MKPTKEAILENKKNKGTSKDYLNYKDMYAKYKAWVLSLSSANLKKNMIISGIIVILLPTISTVGNLFHFPQFITTTISLPAGFLLFAMLLAVAFLSEKKNPERLTLKERYSFNQRLKWVSIAGIVALSLLVFLGPKVPYAFGGIFAMAIGLLVYNGLQRTPSEIEYFDEGVMDPRDEALMLREESRKTKKPKGMSKVEEENE